MSSSASCFTATCVHPATPVLFHLGLLLMYMWSLSCLTQLPVAGTFELVPSHSHLIPLTLQERGKKKLKERQMKPKESDGDS